MAEAAIALEELGRIGGLDQGSRPRDLGQSVGRVQTPRDFTAWRHHAGWGLALPLDEQRLHQVVGPLQMGEGGIVIPPVVIDSGEGEAASGNPTHGFGRVGEDPLQHGDFLAREGRGIDIGQVVVWRQARRVERDGVPEHLLRLVLAAQGLKGGTQFFEDRQQVGLDLEGLAEGRGRLFIAAEMGERTAKVVVGLVGLGIEGRRTLDELDGLLGAPVLHLDHAEDMDGRGVARIEAERVIYRLASLVELVAQEQSLGFGAEVTDECHLAGRQRLGHGPLEPYRVRWRAREPRSMAAAGRRPIASLSRIMESTRASSSVTLPSAAATSQASA